MAEIRFCPDCGAPTEPHVVAGEPRNHRFCSTCNKAFYDHPMVVVTCFLAYENRLLWVRRDIEPRRGLWAIPGGYLEGGETLAQGAARELHEEAGILLPPEQLQMYMTGTLTFINQVYVGFRATIDTDFCLPGRESQACAFYTREECPWDQVAYPQVNSTIEQVYDDLDRGEFDVWQAEMTESRYDILPVSQYT